MDQITDLIDRKLEVFDLALENERSHREQSEMVAADLRLIRDEDMPWLREWIKEKAEEEETLKKEFDVYGRNPSTLVRLAFNRAERVDFEGAQAYLDEALDIAPAETGLRPTAYSFWVTARCNLRCKHCLIFNNVEEDDLVFKVEMSAAEYIQIVEKLVPVLQTNGGWIHFSGGEVFARKDIQEIFAGVAAAGLKFSITTNGTLPNRLARALDDPAIAAALHTIQISIDGDREVCDEIRGPGVFDNIVKSVKIAQDHGVTVKGLVCIQRDNVDNLEEILDVFDRLNITDNMFLPEMVETDLNYDHVYRGKAFMRDRDYLWSLYGRKLPGKGCLAGIRSIVMMPDGKVHACRESMTGVGHELILGDLKEFDYDMAALLASEHAREVQRRVAECPGCSSVCER